MNRPLALSLVLILNGILSLASQAQKKTHHGFYYSIGLGSVSGGIYGSDNSGNKINVDGPAFGLDFQIGGPIKEDLILHGTISAKSISGPTINSVKVPDNYSFGESLLGIGLTKYLNHNFLLSGTIGIGNYSLSQNSSSSSAPSISSDRGFSYQAKIGKEWWVSSKWALGAALTYSSTSVNSAGEQWNSNRFGIMLTGTRFKNH